jgi:hypothetical protein
MPGVCPVVPFGLAKFQLRHILCGYILAAMTTDATIDHPISETSFAPLSDKQAATIQERGTKYFKDICIINSNELIPYLLWLFAKEGKKWPISDKQMKNLSLFLSGISKKQMVRGGLLSRQSVHNAQNAIFRSINLPIPSKISAIDNPNWTQLFLNQLLYDAGIDHKKFSVQLPQPQTQMAPTIATRIQRRLICDRVTTHLAIIRCRRH